MPVNRLQNEHSPYLRDAALQPVHWYPWSEAAFEAARAQNRPILLDIGAAWCHWCHVMDAESYENQEIAEIINASYVAIKVDRDERPDVDARYQAAVSAITGQGGWPLTGFLTPEGRLFYGGTYFPPEERHGRQSFPEILRTLAKAFEADPAKIAESAGSVEAFLHKALNRAGQSGELSFDLIDKALGDISREFDIRHGGFGTAPKFPHPAALELLLAEYNRTGTDWMIQVVSSTLRAMAKGGIRDHLDGGFHRYSTDRTWTVPHFEKMLYDNAPLLKTYVHAYQATGEALFREVALEIIRFVFDVLTEPKTRCFSTSQDADRESGDDGSYFTWTIEEARALLEPQEFEVARLRFRLTGRGEMPHNEAQHVLFIDKELHEVADQLGMPFEHAADHLDRACQKLRTARRQRRAPAVDRTIYASWNGMMISALFEAWKAFGVDEFRDAALASLNSILETHRLPTGLIAHRAARLAPEAFLEDQTSILASLLAAYEVTMRSRYLDEAESLAEALVVHFSDGAGAAPSGDGGAFNDVPVSSSPLATLTIKNKQIQDSPTASPNAVAALCLLTLAAVTGKSAYRDRAEHVLRSFAGGVEGSGLYVATYALALHRLFFPPVRVIVAGPGHDARTQALRSVAMRTFRPGKIVLQVKPESLSLPSEAKAFLAVSTAPSALVCGSTSCSAPVSEPRDLERLLQTFDRRAHA